MEGWELPCLRLGDRIVRLARTEVKCTSLVAIPTWFWADHPGHPQPLIHCDEAKTSTAQQRYVADPSAAGITVPPNRLRDLQGFSGLAASMTRTGLLVSVAITGSGVLVSGCIAAPRRVCLRTQNRWRSLLRSAPSGPRREGLLRYSPSTKTKKSCFGPSSTTPSAANLPVEPPAIAS